LRDVRVLPVLPGRGPDADADQYPDQLSDEHADPDEHPGRADDHADPDPEQYADLDPVEHADQHAGLRRGPGRPDPLTADAGPVRGGRGRRGVPPDAPPVDDWRRTEA